MHVRDLRFTRRLLDPFSTVCNIIAFHAPSPFRGYRSRGQVEVQASPARFLDQETRKNGVRDLINVASGRLVTMGD